MSTGLHRHSAGPLATERAARSAWSGGLRQRALSRVVEGPHLWGEQAVWPSRYGYTSYCLVVYPPGSTRSERFRFRLIRGWPPIGMLLGVLAVIAAVPTIPWSIASLLGAAVYGTGAAGLALLAGPIRHGIRTLWSCRSEEGTSPIDLGSSGVLDELFALLVEAERELRAGDTDAVTFELVHGQVWHQLGSPRLGRG